MELENVISSRACDKVTNRIPTEFGFEHESIVARTAFEIIAGVPKTFDQIVSGGCRLRKDCRTDILFTVSPVIKYELFDPS